MAEVRKNQTRMLSVSSCFLLSLRCQLQTDRAKRPSDRYAEKFTDRHREGIDQATERDQAWEGLGGRT